MIANKDGCLDQHETTRVTSTQVCKVSGKYRPSTGVIGQTRKSIWARAMNFDCDSLLWHLKKSQTSELDACKGCMFIVSGLAPSTPQTYLLVSD